MTNKSVATANGFFRDMTRSRMSSHEATVYDLKIERAALLRDANAYAMALNRLARYHDECSARLEARHNGHDLHGRKYRDKVERQRAAHEREIAKLNAEFPNGYARESLRAINAAINKANQRF